MRKLAIMAAALTTLGLAGRVSQGYRFGEPQKDNKNAGIPRFRTIIGLISGPAII
jgi:hypothetical protein